MSFGDPFVEIASAFVSTSAILDQTFPHESRHRDRIVHRVISDLFAFFERFPCQIESAYRLMWTLHLSSFNVRDVSDACFSLDIDLV